MLAAKQNMCAIEMVSLKTTNTKNIHNKLKWANICAYKPGGSC